MPVDRRQRGLLGAGIAHVGDVGQPHGAAIAAADQRLPQSIGVLGVGEHAHRLYRARDLRLPAGRVDVVLAQLRVDRRRRQAIGLQLHRIERHPDFAAHPAMPLHRRHAGDRQQLLRHGVVDVPAQLFDGHVAGNRGEIGDVVVGRVDAADLWLQDTVGQVRPDLRDLVAQVVDRAVDVGADLELEDGGRLAFADGRTQLVDALDTARGGLDALGHLRLQLGGRGARLADLNIGDREFDVRIVIDVEPHEADDPRDRQRQEQDDRRHRVADRPGGDVAKAHGLARLSGRNRGRGRGRL